MNRYNLVICDDDVVFMGSFQKYINKQEENNFKVRCFSSVEYLKKYTPTKEDILLITPELFFEDLFKYGFKNIIQLVTPKNQGGDFKNKVQKYQPAINLLNEVKSYADSKGIIDFSEEINKGKLLTFYSPVGGVGNTILSILTSYILARRHNKVLYINLEDVQSIKAFINCTGNKKNLSHLLCYSNESQSNFTKGLKGIVSTSDEFQFDYFQPFDSVLDIDSFNGEGYELINKIINTNIYDYVIMDMGNTTALSNKNILRSSDRLVLTTTQDKIAISKVTNILEQFYDLKNIRLVINKVDGSRENLVAEIIKDFSIPVAGKIFKNKNAEGVEKIRTLINNSEFFFDVTKVAENLLV